MLTRARAIARKVRVRLVRDAAGAQIVVFLHGRPFARGAAVDGEVARVTPLDGPKLNVGGGKGHPHVAGWTIVDLRAKADVKVDIAQEPLPFDDGSVAVVFCSHTLEHIRRSRLSFVLSEFHRVLAPGGLLRVVVPDAERAVRAYAEGDRAFFTTSEVSQPDAEAPLGGLLAAWFYSERADDEHGFGHVHAFDFDYLASWLRAAGFARVWRSEYRGSALPELRADAFDRHPRDSLFVEALR